MFMLVVLIPAIGWMTWSARAARLLEAELAKIRAAGEPLDAAGLGEFYALPREREDVTELRLEVTTAFEQPAFAKAGEDLPVVGSGDDPPPPGEAWEQLEAVEQLLQTYAAEMDKIHEAVRLGGAARFDLDFEDGGSSCLTYRTCGVSLGCLYSKPMHVLIAGILPASLRRCEQCLSPRAP